MASKVVSDVLDNIEGHKSNLKALRAHLQEGDKQAERGEFVNQSLDEMLTEFKNG